METFVYFVPGQRALWKITTDQDGNEVLLIRDGVPRTPFLQNMIRDVATRRGLICELANALHQWNLSAVPRPRSDTEATSQRIQQLRVEKILHPDPGKQPAAGCEPLPEYE